MNKIINAAVALLGGDKQVTTAEKKPSALGKDYIDEQSKIIEKHKALLVAEGRMPSDFWGAHEVLGRFGWHSSADPHVNSIGVHAHLCVLQHGSLYGRGSFGAYSFHPPAFEQARRSWWIHGVMEGGSDILHPVNRGAIFTDEIVGHIVQYIWASGTDVRKAVVLEIPKYSDGSSTCTLRLDQKAPAFAMTYDIAILPPDYVDMSESSFQVGK